MTEATVSKRSRRFFHDKKRQRTHKTKAPEYTGTEVPNEKTREYRENNGGWRSLCNAWIPLNQLRTGEKGRVAALDLSGDIRRRMLDLGMVTDTVVEMIGKSPSGDPTAYGIRGAMIAIRDKDASGIWIRPME